MTFRFQQLPEVAPITLLVNRFVPLINYKRDLERAANTDLYGRRLLFVGDLRQPHPLEFVQEYLETQQGDRREIVLYVLFEEAGG